MARPKQSLLSLLKSLNTEELDTDSLLLLHKEVNRVGFALKEEFLKRVSEQPLLQEVLLDLGKPINSPPPVSPPTGNSLIPQAIPSNPLIGAPQAPEMNGWETPMTVLPYGEDDLKKERERMIESLNVNYNEG